MDSLPPELSLDIRPTFVPNTINAFLKDLSMIGNGSEKVTKLDDFVRRLEEEMRKVDAFKRELPLCMLLLHDAIFALKCESLKFKVPKAGPESLPVLEEFIPMKKQSENEGISKEKECKDKKDWVSTFQLYDYQPIDPPKSSGNKGNEEEIDITAEVDAFPIKKRNKGTGGGRAFWPSSPFSLVTKEEREELPVPGLSLLTPKKNLREESGSSGFRTSCSKAVSCPATDVQSSSHAGPLQSPTARKQRRCWSPELHRRFVNALQQLGGSQATPKQIREFMQVDGLTNDEVKSHLQKYRLHTRRASGATRATTANQSVVVLGGLWMPQDQCGESSKANTSQSDSPQGPFQLGTPGSVTGSDSMDDDEDEDEDEKSESYSWKSHIHRPI